MPERAPRLLVNGYAETGYNITEFDGRFYATHQEGGVFDIERIRSGTTKWPVYVGETLDEVARRIEVRFDDRTLRDIITGFGWRGRRGLGAELGPHPNDFLLYAFFGSMDDVATALRMAVRERPGLFNLIGERSKAALLAEALSKDGHDSKVIEWAYGDRLPLIPEAGRTILCEVPQTPEDYTALFAFKERFPKCDTIWELTLPIATVRELMAIFDYNVGNPDRVARKVERLTDHQRYFAQMADIYCARRSFHDLPRVLDMLNLKGRSVIEFGPSDGVYTGVLFKTGAEQVTVVEGRPENVVKLLAAKYAMGWDNLEILTDNFQVPGRWASRRYDVVFAHGVFYHCVDPFYFFDQLTRISDTIFIGGWVATDEVPFSEWREIRYRDRSYRVQMYEESASFCAGLTTRSVLPDPAAIDEFFSHAGYEAAHREEVETNLPFSGCFMHWVFRRR